MVMVAVPAFLLILVVALIVLGPKNLPKIANTLGKAMGQFQKASRDFQRTMNTEIALEEEQEKKKAEQQKQAETASPINEETKA